MDIKQLRFLDALAKEKHFSRAASKCFVSQPTLSLRIKQLEEELGVPLIYRGNRYEGLTPEGIRVLSWARRVLQNYENLYQDIALIKGKLHGTLRLGVIPTALPYVSQLTSPFLKKHKNVSIQIESYCATSIQQMLEKFSLDLGITYLSEDIPANTEKHELFKETYVALLPKDELFLDKNSLTWKEAATLPLCLLSKNMNNRKIIEKAFTDAGCTISPQMESNSLLTLYNHVKTGNWATITSRLHADLTGISEQVRVLKIIDPILENPVGLVWHQTDPLSPLINEFLNVIHDATESQ